MTYTIGIQPDYIQHRNGEKQSFSDRWAELAAEGGFGVRVVNASADDFFEQLGYCDGFMWRFGYDPLSLQFAKRVLFAVEHGMKLPVFPSWETAWHFEDKVAQYYLMKAAGILTPRTWVWWTRNSAMRFSKTATYPLVGKLASGIQSNNVRLLRTFDEARELINQVFGGGLTSMEEPDSFIRKFFRNRLQAFRLMAGKPLPRGIQHGYFYVQEFVPDNDFDTRVTVIGNRAFAFRRFNRPHDFRASGGGRIDWDPAQIDPDMVNAAFQVADRLRTQSVAIDGLKRDDECVINEISYTYASWAVRECPGHWVLDRTPGNEEVSWVEGKLRPEDAIFEDFIHTIARREHHKRLGKVETNVDKVNSAG